MQSRMFDLQVQVVPISWLKPNKTNPRTHSGQQIEKIGRSIKTYGWMSPILVDDEYNIIAGNGRYAAARDLRCPEVPVLKVTHLTPAQRRAYVIADNKLAEQAGWDRDMLAIEFQALTDEGINLEDTGFEIAEADIILREHEEGNSKEESGPQDEIPALHPFPVTQQDDLWLLGRHRLRCGDATIWADVEALLAGDEVAAVFTDPPYNVPVSGHVSTKQRREFVMGSGEMTDLEFATFLARALTNCMAMARAGAIAFITIDWRHLGEVLHAARALDFELKNICIWNKTNGGMGSLYRSQHELIPVFKMCPGPHINNVKLGTHGRNRTNVWTYAGLNAGGSKRDEELAMHPTCKPVALIRDAIEDVTRRGDIVLDVFGGSGSTLIAAEKCGRVARLLELDPLYCDVILRRFALVTGKQPTLALTGETFEQVMNGRLTELRDRPRASEEEEG